MTILYGLLIPGSSEEVINDVNDIVIKEFSITDPGQVNEILGIEIKRDMVKGTIYLN